VPKISRIKHFMGYLSRFWPSIKIKNLELPRSCPILG
jgi:hypothetical protein